MRIKTAEEFLQDNNVVGMTNLISPLLIEFAKYHVELAIKTCIEEAPSGSSTDMVSYEDVENALKNCYSLENIK